MRRWLKGSIVILFSLGLIGCASKAVDFSTLHEIRKPVWVFWPQKHPDFNEFNRLQCKVIEAKASEALTEDILYCVGDPKTSTQEYSVWGILLGALGWVVETFIY